MKIKKAPFFRRPKNTQTIMLDMVIALTFITIVSTFYFGVRVPIQVAVGVVSAVFFEYAYQKITKQEVTILDLSAVVTGLLVGLSYVVTAPLWIVVLGSFIAIVIVKQLPGGLGRNQINPAVFSRVFMKIILTPLMTSWVTPGPDDVSTATPLTFLGNGAMTLSDRLLELQDAFLGIGIGGNAGETATWAILIAALYLAIRKVIRLEVPIAASLGLFLFAMLTSRSDVIFSLYHVVTGTFLFAAVFMVTDYSSGSLKSKACIYYAFAIGILTGLIRHTYAFPGGVGIAIILMNIIAPYFDSRNHPRVFGHKKNRNYMETR